MLTKKPFRKNWIPEIDGLRALAALVVIFTHYHLSLPNTHISFLRPPTGLPFANLGVILFFVISAFLLTLLITREHNQNNGISVLNFLLRRILRIWPLYFFTIAFAYIELAPWGLLSHWPFSPISSDTWKMLNEKLWTYFAFVSNWDLSFYKFNGTPNSVPYEFRILWSIAVEEQFYLFFPFIMVLWFKLKKIQYVIPVTLITIAVVSRAFFVYYPTNIEHHFNGGMYYFTLTYLDVFVFGAIAGMVAASASFESGVLHKIFHFPGFGMSLCMILLGLLWGWQNDIWYPYSDFCIVAYGLFGMLLATSILWIFVHPAAFVSRILRTSILRFLGRISYGIYAWHFIVLQFVNQLFLFGLNKNIIEYKGLTIYLPLMMFILLTILLSTITYVCIEKPFLKLKNFLLSNNKVVNDLSNEKLVTV